MKVLFFITLLLFTFSYGNAQNPKDSIVTEKGYLIFLGSDWVFQPCSDTAISMFDAINGESFVPGTISYTFGMMILPVTGFGESVFLRFYSYPNGVEMHDTVYYFYCKIELNFNHFSADRIINPCKYVLCDQDKEMELCCRYYSNTILSVEPLLDKDKSTYLSYLQEKGYPLPAWSEKWRAGDTR